MPGLRRFSHHISEGDGIAIIVHVRDAEQAHAAEAQGAKAVAVQSAVDGIRAATTLPVLWTGRGEPVDADAFVLGFDDEISYDDLEPVVGVYDEEQIPVALELHDPEIFLLGTHGSEDPLEAILDMLPDVPAGKLAIAELDVSARDEVLALERAGIDAVLVPWGHVGALVGAGPPEV